MSKYGLKAAMEYGKTLTEFKDVSEAEKYFSCRKDDLLNKFETICIQNSYFSPDYTIGSLKEIEKWYFDLYEKNEFEKIGFTQNEFESILSFYFGEVVVRNNEDAKWKTEEYVFVQGKYEFLVNKGLLSMAINDKFHDLYKRKDNKRRNLLFREYNKYFKDSRT